MKGEDESRFGHLGSLICLLFGSESLGILADKNDVIGICAEWWNLVGMPGQDVSCHAVGFPIQLDYLFSVRYFPSASCWPFSPAWKSLPALRV
jgi:hypothetical protein